MNRWALMLADVPPTVQCLVARRQRISLPRGTAGQPAAPPRSPSSSPGHRLLSASAAWQSAGADLAGGSPYHSLTSACAAVSGRT